MIFRRGPGVALVLEIPGARAAQQALVQGEGAREVAAHPHVRPEGKQATAEAVGTLWARHTAGVLTSEVETSFATSVTPRVVLARLRKVVL